MREKEFNIIEVKENIAWPYSESKWLREARAVDANKKRDKLLSLISKSINYSSMQSKIYTGKLSPGCLVCATGMWSCLFINRLCTANCFFCPQDRNINNECSPIISQGVVFNDPESYVDFLETFNLKGVGFSGGEPLMVFEKLMLFIKEIRKRLGEKIYLWVYTNGDLIDKVKLKRLKDIGLDEIRFNISARGYDLRPVELAVNIIDRVTVEIPAIPEDLEIVKGCLVKMQKIGVSHLNIHQLFPSLHNYRDFIKRGYTFLHHPGIPIFESEMAALEIIRYALDVKVKLPINYCTNIYKYRFHGSSQRKLTGALVKEAYEELTNLGYIRRLSIQGSPVNINAIIMNFERNRIENKLWSVNKAKTILFMRHSLLKYIDFNRHSLIVSYFAPEFVPKPDFVYTDKKIILDSKKKIFIRKKFVFRQKGLNSIWVETFKKLFVENENVNTALIYFWQNYNSKKINNKKKITDEIELLMALRRFEHMIPGFLEIY